MERRLCRVMLCLPLLGLLGLLGTNAFEVEIKDGTNKTCIYASMKVKFIIEYETSSGTSSNVTFAAPDKVTTEGSTCGESGTAPLLNVHFGNGHAWSLNFTKDAEEYRAGVVGFTYNTSDSTLFPDAKIKGLHNTFTQTNFFDPVPLTAAYKCSSEDRLIMEHVVQLYWNVTLQAYMENSALGRDFRCSADSPSTPSPTSHNTTTASTTTANTTTASTTTANTTTASTTTANTTTASTTTATPKPTTKPVDKPAVGNYSIKNGPETCLLASMGLQLNASLLAEGKIVWTVFNINPNTTVVSGNCGNETALLKLNDSSTVVEFHFSTKSKNFHLQEVNVALVNGSGISYQTNGNLSLWEASMDSSYLCRKEQLITVSEALYINTFDVRVQPFNVHNATYATAEDCFVDQDFTIPIVVGAVLGALVIVVMVAYFIGRRNRRSAGYEHF